MSKRGEISGVVDGLLTVLVAGGVVSVGLCAPNAIQALDKPLRLYFRNMDERKRERELRKALRYMRAKGLAQGSYEHGLKLTKKGRLRAEKAELDNLQIKPSKIWDKKWRLVFFDIPEEYKSGRDALTSKMRLLGLKQLQKSAWIYPHECRQEIELVSVRYRVAPFVTYVETSYIDSQEKLQKLFNIN